MTSNRYHKRYVVLGFTGLLFGCVLLLHHVEINSGLQSGPSACAINEVLDCDAVAKSSFSVILGLPTASWALLFYFGLLLFLSGRDKPKAGSGVIESDIIFLLSLAAAVPTVYLFTVSALVLQKICIYCTVLYLTNLLLLVLSWCDPERTRPAGAALRRATGSLLRFGLRFYDSALLVFCFLAFAAALLVAPERLIKPYLGRSQVKVSDQVTRKLIFDTWNAGPQFEIPLETAADPVNRDWSKGPADAPITLVEFFDYTCPHCQHFGLAAEDLLRRYPRDLRLVLRNFPLDPSCNRYTPKAKHMMSCRLALTARCVALKDPDMFWRYNRLVYSHAQLDQAGLDKIVAAVGADKNDIDSCTMREDIKAKIAADTDAGFKLRVKHTPTIFINGKPAESGEISRIEVLIEELLRRRKLQQAPAAAPPIGANGAAPDR